MTTFRALNKQGDVLGETEAADTWGAIVWADKEFRAKQPRVSALTLERKEGEGWVFASSTEVGLG